MDPRKFDTELQERIRALLLKKKLREGTPAFPIAMQIIRQGFQSLSWKQRIAYLNEMVPILRGQGFTVGLDCD